MAMAFRTGPALECGRFKSSETAVCTASSFSLVGGLVPQIHRPEDYVSALEEERRKVEAFQRELPLCMRLLQDAIQIHKEKLTISTGSTGRLTNSCTDLKCQSRSDWVMEESKPLRGTPGSLHTEDEPGQNKPCKHSWTEGCTAEAKSDNTMNCQTNIMTEQASLPRMCQQMPSMTPKPHFSSSNYSGGAFMPFSKDNQVIRPTPRHGTLDPKDLNTRDTSAVFCQAVKPSALVPKVVKENGQQPKEVAAKVAAAELKAGVNNKLTARKGRRCWSPHLHRSFVNALQQLGGSEAATPKQIREVMRVDGLTNEEIKSHLQKYRLHARRLGTKQSSCVQPPHVVVLSETWVPSGYTFHLAGKQASSSVLQDNCLELESSIDHEVHLHDPSCCEQKSIPAHWSSLQGHLQFWENQPVMAYQPLQDKGREESMEDNGGVGDSSCGSGQPKYELQGGEVDDARSRDGSCNAN